MFICASVRPSSLRCRVTEFDSFHYISRFVFILIVAAVTVFKTRKNFFFFFFRANFCQIAKLELCTLPPSLEQTGFKKKTTKKNKQTKAAVVIKGKRGSSETLQREVVENVPAQRTACPSHTTDRDTSQWKKAEHHRSLWQVTTSSSSSSSSTPPYPPKLPSTLLQSGELVICMFQLHISTMYLPE